MADVAALLGSILESVSPASPPVVASQSGGVAPDQWSLEEQGRDAAAHSASVDVTDASSPGTRGAQARANSHQVGGVGSPLSSCMGRVLDGEISLRLRKTTLLAALLPAAIFVVRACVASLYGADSWQGRYATAALFLSLGVSFVVFVTVQTAGCDNCISGGDGDGGVPPATAPSDAGSVSPLPHELSLSYNARMAICWFGIVASFLFYGYVLERLTTGRQLPEVAAILINSVVYTAVSWLTLFLQGYKSPLSGSSASKQWKFFIMIALSSKLATWCTWRALRFVSFPTQVLAKSCKALPIMCVNRLAGKRHSWTQYSSVSLITVGVLVFSWLPTLDKPQPKENSSLLGFGLVASEQSIGGVLLLTALFFDGVTGHLEDTVIKRLEWKHGQGTFDLMLQINFHSCYMALGYLVLSNNIAQIVMPLDELSTLLWLSMAGALGQMCIFYTISNFGALTCSIITTVRKVLQIGLSSLAFGHHFSGVQNAGLVVTFLGIFININDKRRPKTHSQTQGALDRRLLPGHLVPIGGVKRPNYDDNYLAATRSSI